MDPPECPVCFHVYNNALVVPRVLACGHSVCETCLLQLPHRFKHTIRCPICNQLVNYPELNGGATALPKNIDLLRLSLAASTSKNDLSDSNSPHRRSPGSIQPHCFAPSSLYDNHLYPAWKHWILSADAVSFSGDLSDPEFEEVGFCSVLHGAVVSSCSNSSSCSEPCFCFRCCLECNGLASLIRVASCPSLQDSVFDCGPNVQIMNCLREMREAERAELGLILRASFRNFRVCDSYGLWYNSKDAYVYLVCARHSYGVFNRFNELECPVRVDDGAVIIDNTESIIADKLLIFAMNGTQLCESVIGLHSVGLIAGCLSLSFFQSDNLGQSYVDLNMVLVTGRKVQRYAMEENISGLQGENCLEMEGYLSCILQDDVFVSPEVLFWILKKKWIVSELGVLIYPVCYGSDSWSLGCLLLNVLIGKTFVEFLTKYMCAILKSRNDKELDCIGWIKKVTSLLEDRIGSKYVQLLKILGNCLHFDPNLRPLVNDVLKCIRGLIIKPQYDNFVNSECPVIETKISCCLILGELCKYPWKTIKESKTSARDNELHVGEMGANKDFLRDLSNGKLEVKDLRGHLDCITGLAVGGDFLFSSSYDKTIHVWSMQDFSLVHSFRGHEHRVMALVIVEVEEESFCISGDSGGGIFIWDISGSLKQEPIKKWYEQKDWRFSGIHALAVSGSNYLYTGSGDKSIKAWCLREYTLSCTMTGHKSVVCSLAVCGGVLYSGSWDGCIWLWSVNDHTPLTVLGEHEPIRTPVLSLIAHPQLLVAALENGTIKIWKNDEGVMRVEQVHDGSIFGVGMWGKWLFTGGVDKSVKVQEVCGDDDEIEVLLVGCIPCDSVITTLLCWENRVFVGFADQLIKVLFFG